MKLMLVAAVAALSLATSCGPVTDADNWGRPPSTFHQVAYDNSGHGGNQGGGGGGG